MAIDRSEVEKVAHLARLTISEADISATTQTIGQILDLVDQMQAVDTGDIKPLASPLEENQRLREDRVSEVNQREQLQANAPATENGLFLVPKVID